jgi:hypothetical protein
MGIGAKGTRLFGRYALIDKLADGARGEVWSALDERTDESVAIELLPSAILRRADDWARLKRAYVLAARLAHSNILAIHEPLRCDSATAVPMQIARGGDARKLIGSPYFESLPVLIDVAEALRHAHGLGIAHLDLTLRNVLLDESNCALVRGFAFEGGSAAEFDAAVRKDLRDFATIGLELIGGPVADGRSAPPRLRALFDRIYDSSFARVPLSFDDILVELDASRHDTAPLSVDRIDFELTPRLLRPDTGIIGMPVAADIPAIDADDDAVRLERHDSKPAPRVAGSVAMPTDSINASWASLVSANDAFINDASNVDSFGSDVAVTVETREPVVAVPECAQASTQVAGADVATEADVAVETPSTEAPSPDATPLVLEPPPIMQVVPPPAESPVDTPVLASVTTDVDLRAGTGATIQELRQFDHIEPEVPPRDASARVKARQRAIAWRWVSACVAGTIVSIAVWLGGRNPPPSAGEPAGSQGPQPSASQSSAHVSSGATVVASGIATSAAIVPAAPVTVSASPREASVASGGAKPVPQPANTSAQREPARRLAAATSVPKKPNKVSVSGSRDAPAARPTVDRTALTNAPRPSSDAPRPRAARASEPLLSDAQRAEAAGDWNRAAQGYGHVLAVDRRNAQARAGIARLREAVGREPFSASLLSANVALGGGRLDEARAAFAQALELRPGDARARAGYEGAEAALTARRLAPFLRRAATFERLGAWRDALRVYEEILSIEPGYVLAQQGRQRAALRAGTEPRPSISVASGAGTTSGG